MTRDQRSGAAQYFVVMERRKQSYSELCSRLSLEIKEKV